MPPTAARGSRALPGIFRHPLKSVSFIPRRTQRPFRSSFKKSERIGVAQLWFRQYERDRVPMTESAQDSQATRWSLLARLKNWEDQQSWREFFDIYWKLIYSVAIKAGLSDAEAQDVVQDTLVSVAKKMPEFKCEPAAGSFKAWLLKLTRWRILNQLKKRMPENVDTASGAYGPTAMQRTRAL